jgi:mutual gliding-motility protein MglA
LKLVYYGPALSGKTTNLLCLHDKLQQEGRGELMMLDTTEDRTIYFDLLPFFYVAPSGLKIKLKVYTVPGQVRHDATRKAVLQRADGVVFIADSHNQSSRRSMQRVLPIWNRTWLWWGWIWKSCRWWCSLISMICRRWLPEAELRKIWGPTGLPVVMASALQGWGVSGDLSGSSGGAV